MNKKADHLHPGLLIASAILVFTILACVFSRKTILPVGISTETSGSVSTALSNTNSSRAPTDAVIPSVTNEASLSETYLGDANQESGYAVTALKVADPATPIFINYTAKAGMKLVAVDVVISNISGESLYATPRDVDLLDSNNLTYQNEIDAVDNSFNPVALNPGEQEEGWISYTIPETAAPVHLQYSNELLGNAVIKVSLAPPPAGHQPVVISLAHTLPTTKLGDVVTKYGYSMAAKALDDPAQPVAGYETREGYKIVAVELVLNNISSTAPLDLNSYNIFLVDDKGFVYWSDGSVAENELPIGNLNIGGTAQGWITFPIPQGAKPVYIKYETQNLSGDFLITGLTK